MSQTHPKEGQKVINSTSHTASHTAGTVGLVMKNTFDVIWDTKPPWRGCYWNADFGKTVLPIEFLDEWKDLMVLKL